MQPQHHRDIRTVFVKEESPILFNEIVASQVNKHIQWNIEPVNSESAASPCKCWSTPQSHLGKQGLFVGQDGYNSMVYAECMSTKLI